MMAVPVLFTATSYLVLCAVWDVQTRRIPNWLSVGGMLAGLGVNLVWFGLPGLVVSLAGLLVIGAVLLPPFALGGIGGGDVKMMAALGSFLGPVAAVKALLLGVVLGGVVMVAHLLRARRLREKLVATGNLFVAAATARSLRPLALSANGPDVVALPYSVPLGLGAIAVMILSSIGVS